MKTLAKLILLVFIIISCKKDFGENKNLLVETFKIPKASENNVIFKHDESIYFIGFEEEYDSYTGFSKYYSVYSFDLKKGRFKPIQKNVKLDSDIFEYSDEANKIISATSCKGDVYVLTQKRTLIRLESDFSYDEDDEISRYPDALGIFSLNNLVFVTLSNNKFVVYDPITKVPVEVEIKGNPVRQIIKNDNFFYLASGKKIYKSLDCKSWEILFNVFPESNKELLSINYDNGHFICATKSEANVYTVKINSNTGQVLTFTDPFDYSLASIQEYSYLEEDYYDDEITTEEGYSGYGYVMGSYYFSFVDEYELYPFNSDYPEYNRSIYPLVSEDLSIEETKIANGYVFKDISREGQKNNLNVIQIENYLIYLDESRLKKVTIHTD